MLLTQIIVAGVLEVTAGSTAAYGAVKVLKSVLNLKPVKRRPKVHDIPDEDVMP